VWTVVEFPEDSSRARGDREAEEWLRRELEFLRGVERRILRRARVREDAWRAVAVTVILAMFACCWYLAALSSGDSAGSACPTVSSIAGGGAGAGLAVARPAAAAEAGAAVTEAVARDRARGPARADVRANTSNTAKVAAAAAPAGCSV
jgi:hypothetical protein